MSNRIIARDEAWQLRRLATPGPWNDRENCDYRKDGTPIAWREVETTPAEGHERKTLATLVFGAREDAVLMSAAPDLAYTVVMLHLEMEALKESIRALVSE